MCQGLKRIYNKCKEKEKEKKDETKDGMTDLIPIDKLRVDKFFNYIVLYILL